MPDLIEGSVAEDLIQTRLRGFVLLEAELRRARGEADHLRDLSRSRRLEMVLTGSLFQCNQLRQLFAAAVEIAAQCRQHPHAAAAGQRGESVDETTTFFGRTALECE